MKIPSKRLHGCNFCSCFIQSHHKKLPTKTDAPSPKIFKHFANDIWLTFFFPFSQIQFSPLVPPLKNIFSLLLRDTILDSGTQYTLTQYEWMHWKELPNLSLSPPPWLELESRLRKPSEQTWEVARRGKRGVVNIQWSHWGPKRPSWGWWIFNIKVSYMKFVPKMSEFHLNFLNSIAFFSSSTWMTWTCLSVVHIIHLTQWEQSETPIEFGQE